MSQAALFNTAWFPAASSSIASQRAARSRGRSVHTLRPSSSSKRRSNWLGLPGSAVTSHVSRSGRPTLVPAPTTMVTPQPASKGKAAGGLAQTPTTVVHPSRRTAASSYSEQGHGCRPASDSADVSAYAISIQFQILLCTRRRY